MTLPEQIMEYIKDIPHNNELILVITPNKEKDDEVFMKYRYRPISDIPRATKKQIKFIKDMMQEDPMDLYIKHYEDLTKDEACSIIKYLLEEGYYNEKHIEKYRLPPLD